MPSEIEIRNRTMALQFEILAVTPFRQNCTLLWDDETREAVLTDMGGDVPFVLNEVAARRLDVKEIWLTHGHLDHAGGVVEFLSHKDVPVSGRIGMTNSCWIRCRTLPRNTVSPYRLRLNRPAGWKKAMY